MVEEELRRGAPHELRRLLAERAVRNRDAGDRLSNGGHVPDDAGAFVRRLYAPALTRNSSCVSRIAGVLERASRYLVLAAATVLVVAAAPETSAARSGSTQMPDPVRIAIPSIGVNAPVVPLGL